MSGRALIGRPKGVVLTGGIGQFARKNVQVREAVQEKRSEAQRPEQ